jgi:hypothetical protein
MHWHPYKNMLYLYLIRIIDKINFNYAFLFYK